LIIILIVLKQGGFMTWPIAVNGSVAKTDFNALKTILENGNIFENLIANGGFEIWQRGSSFSGVTNMFTADMWKFAGSNAGYTVTRESSTLHSGTYSFKIVITNTTKTIRQSLENWKELEGKTVSFSAWVKSSAASTVRLYLYDGTGGANSSFNTGTGWERLTVSRSLSGISELTFYIEFVGTSGLTAYVDDAMAVQGSEAADFTPRNPGLEQMLCERWYEKGTYRSGIPTTNKELRLACRFRELKAGSTFTVSFVPAIYDDSDTDDTSHWTVNSYYTNDILFIILTRDVAQAGNYYINADWNVQVDS
jgi:hypothetical protein